MSNTKHQNDLIDVTFDLFESLLGGFMNFVEWVFKGKSHILETDFEEKGNIVKSRYCREGISVDGGGLALDRKTCFENVAMFGGTGTGKGVNCVIPSALHLDDASIIIHDPSGTVYDATVGNFERKGYTVRIIDWADSSTSSAYNPLAHIKNSTEISSIAHLLINASMGNSSADPFWRLASESQLTMLIALSLELPKHLQHFPNILHMLEHLSHSPKTFDRFVARFCSSEKIWSQYKSYISQSEKLNSSITANTKAALKLFEMDDLATTMSHNEIDFSSLRKEKTVIYLKNNIAQQKLYGPATSIFITQLFEYVFSTIPKESEYPIFMLLDEMSSIYISEFSTYLSNVRKHKCSVLHAWQSLSQIKEKYKDQADAILANSRSQLYLPSGMDFESAQALSNRMGEYEWEDEKGRRSKRKLMHPQELIQTEVNRGYLLVGHHRPVELTMTPYYKRRKLRKWSEMRPASIGTTNEPRHISLIDFKQI